MIKSNINISSNIYIRRHRDLYFDKQYIEQVVGANRLKEIKNRYSGSLSSIKLNKAQDEIANGTVKCSYDKSGEISYGPVLQNGSMCWENRCENISCAYYKICSTEQNFKAISREPVPMEDTQEEDDLRQFMDMIGIRLNDDTVEFDHDKSPETEEEPKKYIPPAEPVAVNNSDTPTYSYTEIQDSRCIIQAPIDSHIILNSGPGTGKTYTIIQRLIYILSGNLCPADEIYILCYTRSAKGVVERKIEQAVTEGKIPPSAQNICVLTFDSYATYFLMEMKEQGVIKEDFSGYDYNERIRLFNRYISSEDFEGISYFIVDEIQDLVNERAEMVLKILENLTCGYLLAGDRCQSIYDYAADDEVMLDSVEFYKKAEAQFPDDMQRYEIIVNKRQCPELATKSHEMRQVLLHKPISEQNCYAQEVIDSYFENIKIEKYISSLSGTPSSSTAILCRNNGEAEYISSVLCKNGIPHTLNRGVNNTKPLPKWMADIFWDYCNDSISKKTFIERFDFRCGFRSDSEMLWQQLCKLSGSRDTSSIGISKLISALSIPGNIPESFYEKSPLLTVSTIHKAKGSEFERVILIRSKIDHSDKSAEEARVRYVALTRPKNQFVVMKKNPGYYKRTITGRVIETGCHNLYARKNKFCKCITVGMSGDIDSNSFVSGSFDDCIDLQEYISGNIRMYDKLTAVRSSDGSYDIMHNGTKIGTLSAKMENELLAGIQSTDYKYNMPDSLDNLYISDITSELLTKFDKNVPLEFQKSRIVYGIQITGLAKLVFEKRK